MTSARLASQPASGLWDLAAAVVLLVAGPVLLFHNLALNPRTWHDEGVYLSVSRTLVEDGVYATRSSDGYQTFGAVQSVGPTVILPVALAYRQFGIGLVQGRAVAAAYALVTLWVFYAAGRVLFDKRVALVAVGFMLGSPAAGYLLNGRQVFGEVPAFGFFLSGWLVWAIALNRAVTWPFVVAGLLVGLAIVTKSQYLVIVTATLGLVAVLDLVYYRQRIWWTLVIVGLTAVLCVALWHAWQISYFGLVVYRENADKLVALARSTMGFNARNTIDAMRFLFGSGSGHYYYFWGWPALIYAGVLALRRDTAGLVVASLCVFNLLWALYFTIWTIPWPRYFLPAGILTALFVARLFMQLASAARASLRTTLSEVLGVMSGRREPVPLANVSGWTIAAVLVLALSLGFQLQSVIKTDVLDSRGEAGVSVATPRQFDAPQAISTYLNQNVAKTMIIETWERELGILTDHKYHYPDQLMLAGTHARIYQGAKDTRVLESAYFEQVRPDYLVIGWFARFFHVYDAAAVARFGTRIATFGSGEWRYDLYRIDVGHSQNVGGAARPGSN